MTSAIWMIELGRTGWRIYAGHDDAAPSTTTQEFFASELTTQAEPIRAALADGGYQGEPLVVALDSRWCLTVKLDVNRPQELRDRQTMLYRFEECIPWSTEECVGDYLRVGTKALMVAAPASPLVEFFSRLESLGVQIQSIVPMALLACAEHVASAEFPARHVVAFEQNRWIDLLCIDNRLPTTWSMVPAHGRGLSCELQRLALDSGASTSLVGYGLSEVANAEIRASGTATVLEVSRPSGESLGTLALAAAAKILGGRMEALIELKQGLFGRSRGHLALRRYAIALRAALVMLVVSATSGFLYRGYTAGCEADLLSEKQVEIFRGVFPNTKTPVGVKSRLESELAKLKGLQGGDTPLPNTASAIAMLHDLLDALPTDRRFMLLEIRIEEGRLYLDGEVRDHGDAEFIAQRLRAKGFEIASPRSQRLDDKRVSIRITGTRLQVARVASRKT